MNKHIFYDNGRLFINTEIGCLANCSYCYLGELGLSKGKVSQRCTSKYIISELARNPHFLWGPDKTIVQFGCYSDPWSKLSQKSTSDIIRYLDNQSYKITLSTKQYVSVDSLSELSYIDKNNLVFLISIPVISKKTSYEKGTSSIRLRVKSIDNLIKNRFRVALYMKPFITDVTLQGLPTIESILNKHNIPVVLGKSFSEDGSGKAVKITDYKDFYENECNQYFIVKARLQNIAQVYEHSYEVFSSE